MDTDSKYQIIRNGHRHTLIIRNVVPEDCGEYVCEARDDRGQAATSTAQLSIRGQLVHSVKREIDTKIQLDVLLCRECVKVLL